MMEWMELLFISLSLVVDRCVPDAPSWNRLLTKLTLGPVSTTNYSCIQRC